MDIWQWVFDLQRDLRETGHSRVADLIDSIPEDKYRSRPERVLAAMPEALAAARALKNPWLEVFFQHWGLSNRINNLAEGEAALSDAVALIEFAHRDATQGCPQSVCATQDVAICYGNIDGPGWAPERLAVCEETLARITPAWPCFSCISGEYADALLDADRPLEALQFLERQALALAEQGEDLTAPYQSLQASAMWHAGQADAALALLDEIDRSEAKNGNGDDIEEQRSRAILRANIFVASGRHVEAAQILPDWSDIQVRSFESWSQVASLLAHHNPERNTWQLGRDLQRSLSHLSKVGAHFDAVVVALRHGELALLRRASWTAKRALGIAQAHVPKLRNSATMAAKVTALAQHIATVHHACTLPVPATELVDYLRQQQTSSDPEQSVEWLLLACKQCPQDADLAQTTASALMACGTLAQAWAQLWQFVQEHPGIDGPIHQLMGSLLDAGEYVEVGRLAQTVAPHNPQTALWIQGQCAHRQQRWADVALHMAAYLQTVPDSVAAKHLWAHAALANQDLPTTLRLRKELATQCTSPSDAHWDLLTIASASQDWTTVHEVSAYLELKLEPSSGPIEQDWGMVYIRFEHNGQYIDAYARRTGPVTARILAPSYGGMPQRLGDWVAFDAALLEQRPQPQDLSTQAQPAQFIPTFRSVYTITAGGFGESCFIDGAAPDSQQFDDFKDALAERGWHCWTTSDDGYQVIHPTTGEPLAGKHFMVSAPISVGSAVIDQTLRSLTAHWTHPVCWPRFAEKSGLDMDYHTEIVELYGL
jgi:hypothetical protein